MKKRSASVLITVLILVSAFAGCTEKKVSAKDVGVIRDEELGNTGALRA